MHVYVVYLQEFTCTCMPKPVEAEASDPLELCSLREQSVCAPNH